MSLQISIKIKKKRAKSRSIRRGTGLLKELQMDFLRKCLVRTTRNQRKGKTMYEASC